MEKFKLPNRLTGSNSKPSVWNEFIQLELKYKPVNLGQGCPDFLAPKHITNTLAEITTGDDFRLNQYTRGFGHPRLVKVLSKLYSKLINREINPLTEILVTSGAYEALYSAIQGHIEVGDEVIIIEPFFDCYLPMVELAGGTPKFIPLRPKTTEGLTTSADWTLDDEELKNLFNARTKMIILNTPHNPIGKVFSRPELEKIAELCKKWNVLCVSDEVYEWLVYDGIEHVRICTLPGMWERTITIGSGGKTFSVTGWKVGWAYGPDYLIKNLQMVHQNSVYCCVTPVQEALAIGFETELLRFETPECYFKSLPRELQVKKKFMLNFLQKAGLKPIIPEGGFFMVSDWTSIAHKVDLTSETDKYRDYRFAKWMTKNKGVHGIPPSAFFSEANKHIGESYVRYCFMKHTKTLEAAAKIFETL